MKPLLLTLLVTSHLVVSNLSFAGNSSGGGSFSYYYKSGQHYRQVKKYLVNVLSDASKEELSSLEAKYNKSIDWNEFIKIVKTAKAEPARGAERENPDGYADRLIMDYDTTTRTITALDLFFQEFNKEMLGNKEVQEMSRMILHETSHLFGIGVENDDERSLEFSEDLNQLAFKYLYRCQNDNGKGAVKILNCKYKKEVKAEETKKLFFKFTRVKQISKKLEFGSRVDTYREDVDGFKHDEVLMSQEDGLVFSYDVQNLKPGSVLAIRHANTQLKANEEIQAEILDENGDNIGEPRIFKVGEDGSIDLIQQLIKLDSGKFVGYLP